MKRVTLGQFCGRSGSVPVLMMGYGLLLLNASLLLGAPLFAGMFSATALVLPSGGGAILGLEGLVSLLAISIGGCVLGSIGGCVLGLFFIGGQKLISKEGVLLPVRIEVDSPVPGVKLSIER